MRTKERIPIVLDIMSQLKPDRIANTNWQFFIKHLGFDDYINIGIECDNKIDSIKNIWENSPDLRLSQVLLNIGILYNKPGVWYYLEEVDYLIENNLVNPEDILFWETYGEDGKQPFKMVSISNMTSEDLEACIITQKRMNPYYKKIMQKVLRYRKLNNINNLINK